MFLALKRFAASRRFWTASATTCRSWPSISLVRLMTPGPRRNVSREARRANSRGDDQPNLQPLPFDEGHDHESLSWLRPFPSSSLAQLELFTRDQSNKRLRLARSASLECSQVISTTSLRSNPV